MTDTPGVKDAPARHLADYWAFGEGAAKIGWGTPGSYTRGVAELSKYLPPEEVHGYVANIYHKATGTWPGAHHDMTKAAHTGAMVALIPDTPSGFVLGGGESMSDLHVTLAHLGEADGLDAGAREWVLTAVKGVCESLLMDGNATISGVGMFDSADDAPVAVYASIDLPGLAMYRTALAESLRGALSAAGAPPMPTEHDFTPHMTLAYCDTEADAVQALVAYDQVGQPITFSQVVVTFAGQSIAYPLRGLASAPDGAYRIAKSATKAEKRYTLAPWYVPDKIDAHDEWTGADEVQAAMWDYVKSDDRRVRLQHVPQIVAGEWVEAMTWPYPVTLPMHKADGTIADVQYPAGTGFLGVEWMPWAWTLVKAGKIGGLSIGGRAQRLPGLAPGEGAVLKHGHPADHDYFLLHPNSHSTPHAGQPLPAGGLHPGGKGPSHGNHGGSHTGGHTHHAKGMPTHAPAHAKPIGAAHEVTVGDNLHLGSDTNAYPVLAVNAHAGTVTVKTKTGKTVVKVDAQSGSKTFAVEHTPASAATALAGFVGTPGAGVPGNAPSGAIPITRSDQLHPGDTLYLSTSTDAWTVHKVDSVTGQVTVGKAGSSAKVKVNPTGGARQGKTYALTPGASKGQHLLGGGLGVPANPSAAPAPTVAQAAPAPPRAPSTPSAPAVSASGHVFTVGQGVYVPNAPAGLTVHTSDASHGGTIDVKAPDGSITPVGVDTAIPIPPQGLVFHAVGQPGAGYGLVLHSDGSMTWQGHNTAVATATVTTVLGGGGGYSLTGVAPGVPAEMPYSYTPTVGTLTAHSNPAYAGNTYKVLSVSGSTVTIETAAGTQFPAQASDLVGLPVGSTFNLSGQQVTVTGHTGGQVQVGSGVSVAPGDPSLTPHSAITGQGAAAARYSAPSSSGGIAGVRARAAAKAAIKPTLPTLNVPAGHPGFDQVVADAAAIVSRPLKDPGYSHSQPGLARLTEYLGYDALPTVVQGHDPIFALETAKTHDVMYRSIGGSRGRSAQQLVDDFQGGTFFAGSGVYGHGTYAGQNLDDSIGYVGSRNTVNTTSAATMRFALPKNANVADYDTIAALYRLWDNWAKAQPSSSDDYKARSLIGEVGAFAAALGYDAIHKPGGNSGRPGKTDYWAILNRATVTVQQGKITVKGGNHGLD